MFVEWSPRALYETKQAVGYVNQFSEKAGNDLYARFEDVATLLSHQPYTGRPGRIEGTREFVAHPNYILVYVVMVDRVRIESVVHSRREYP
jgi:toxin ParE1/3/4